MLKLTGGESLTVSKKYSKEHIDIKILPIFAVGNTKMKDNNNSIDKALISRILSIEFINELENTKGIKAKIKEEEPNIMVYINKLLFKLNKIGEIKGEENTKRIGNKFSNEKVLKLINEKI